MINKQIVENYKKILFVVIINSIIWIIGSSFYFSNRVGGKIYFHVLIIIGSLNLIYFAIYFLKMRRRKINVEQFLKQEVFDSYKRKQIHVFIVTIILFIVVFFIPSIYVGGSLLVIDEKTGLENVVFDLIKDSTDETEKVHSILAWFNRNEEGTENFSAIYYRLKRDDALLHFFDSSFYFEKEPYLGIRNNDPYTIFIARCGRCGEPARLFAEMGKIAGINVSIVHCSGENHDWNEVYLRNNHTIIVDATAVKLPNSNGIKSPEFMQEKIAGEWKKQGEKPKDGNISYVYYNFPNDDKKYDATLRYTDTINITVNITSSKGIPIENVTVRVVSYNRYNWVRDIGINKKTNSTGQCTFKIGGGHYRFSLLHDGDWFPIETEVEKFWEDDNQQFYDYVYETKTITDVFAENPTYILIAFLICLLIIIHVYEKKKS